MIGLLRLLHKKNGLTCDAEPRFYNYGFRAFISCLVILFAVIMFNFVTWNVHGLKQDFKRSLLASDSARYGMDIVCLQETKCTETEDLFLHNGYRLILIEQKHGRHYGLGFVISPRMQKLVQSYFYISDRVAILTFQLPTKLGSNISYRVVNAYGPTMQRATENPQLTTNFYQSLTVAVTVPSRVELYIMGDFNSKLGRVTIEDSQQSRISDHVGRHAVGTRNSNGEHMLNFLIQHNLFAANTAFPHKCRHKTTWRGEVKDWSRPGHHTVPVYTQIDYIVCRSRSKGILQDARSFAGATLRSDHKFVMARLDLCNPYKAFKNKPSKPRYDISHLTCNKDTQRSYQSALTSKISELELTGTFGPQVKLKKLLDAVKDTATEVVGVCRPQQKANHSNDSVLVKLVEKRRKHKLELNTNDSADRRGIRAIINRTQKSIQLRLKELKAQAADHLVNTIARTDESRRMFEAVRTLTSSKPSQPIIVHNSEGHVIASDSDKADAIKNYFEQQFTGNEPPLEPFIGPAKPLNTPITDKEVLSALTKLKNNRACGPDDIPNELLKYAGELFASNFASIINECFETNTYIKAIGESILTPLQKPGKPKGPPKSLRPLNLLNGVRKILSIIALTRTQDQINNYTGPWQCGYKSGRSCADIVWSQRMLISVVLRKQFEFHKMGIDMSSAFDTIKRSTILRLLEDAGCSEDDIRLVRLLLAGTTIKVRVNDETSAEFVSTNGSFQGDSLSGALFTLTLAGGLNQVRAVVPERPNPPISDTGMPLEWEYSDDTDFADLELEPLQELLPTCRDVFSEWNLLVNEDKTEFVHFYVAGKEDVDTDGVPLLGNEPWRFCKSLGSLLCSTADIAHRIALAWSAFQTYSKLWLCGVKIPLERKLVVYEAQVISVLLYNCSSWSAPKAVMEKLNVCHRKHLRRICNILYPGVIKNQELYRRCNAVPITERVRKARWTLLGHILRMDDNCPASLAFRYAVEASTCLRGRRGRPRTNLFSVIQADLKMHNITLNCVSDILYLKSIAYNRAQWRNMFAYNFDFG